MRNSVPIVMRANC